MVLNSQRRSWESFNNFIQYLTCFVFFVVFSISKNKVVVLLLFFLIIIPIVPVLCRWSAEFSGSVLSRRSKDVLWWKKSRQHLRRPPSRWVEWVSVLIFGANLPSKRVITNWQSHSWCMCCCFWSIYCTARREGANFNPLDMQSAAHGKFSSVVRLKHKILICKNILTVNIDFFL